MSSSRSRARIVSQMTSRSKRAWFVPPRGLTSTIDSRREAETLASSRHSYA